MLQAALFQDKLLMWSPFAGRKVALLQAMQVAGSELWSFANGVPIVPATILTVACPPCFATYVTVQGPVWPNTKFPPPDPSPLTGIALDVAPVLYQSWPVGVADPVLLQTIQDIHFHHLSCHAEPFCRALPGPFAGPYLALLQDHSP